MFYQRMWLKILDIDEQHLKVLETPVQIVQNISFKNYVDWKIHLNLKNQIKTKF